MKYRLIFALFFVSFLVFKSSSAQTMMVLLNEREAYKIVDTIDFSVVNNFYEDYIVEVSLEKSHNNEWYTAKDNIFQCCSCMHRPLILLKKRKEEKLRWSMSFFLTDPTCVHKISKHKLKGYYRFRVYYRMESDTSKPLTVVSKSFKCN